MAYRNIYITSAATLNIKNNQLVIKTYEENTVPIEDINAIMLESQQINLNTYVLDFLMQNNVCVFFCDQKHTPSGQVLPFNSHCRKLKVLNSQLQIKKPLQKQLWKEIITQKIKNQATVLQLLDFKQATELFEISRKVLSGDENNMEAVAAAKYFKVLFGSDFARGKENIINACLNYGYAIIRGLVARSLVAYGFSPEIGLFHHSQLNAFNLADDILEVYRPCVDLYVAQNLHLLPPQLDTQAKQKLFNILSHSTQIDGKKQSISYAIDLTVQSLSNVVVVKQTQSLKLCEVIPLCLHCYE